MRLAGRISGIAGFSMVSRDIAVPDYASVRRGVPGSDISEVFQQFLDRHYRGHVLFDLSLAFLHDWSVF
jgi:hypothetical protein